MCEHWLGQEDAALFQGLALGFMDRHSPRQAHWKLSATEYERKFRSSTAEGYAWEQVSFSLGPTCEDPHVEESSADLHNEAAASIAYASLLIEVPQDYHYSPDPQT